MVDPEYALIRAIAAGDQEAFERLVERYQNPLCNFIYRYLGDRATAEDITQEVFMRVYRFAPRFAPKARVSSWVFQIARNLALNEIERRRRQRVDETAVDGEPGSHAHAAPASSELEQEVMGALRDLPENQRAALLLRVNEELSYREIGEILGLSVQSVESLLFRARQQLRASLGRRQGSRTFEPR
jgi:RNA polymerase sigma-70 factor (ECF subfamily)